MVIASNISNFNHVSVLILTEKINKRNIFYNEINLLLSLLSVPFQPQGQRVLFLTYPRPGSTKVNMSETPPSENATHNNSFCAHSPQKMSGIARIASLGDFFSSESCYLKREL